MLLAKAFLCANLPTLPYPFSPPPPIHPLLIHTRKQHKSPNAQIDKAGQIEAENGCVAHRAGHEFIGQDVDGHDADKAVEDSS